MSVVLEVTDLRKSFGDTEVIKGINFSLNEGEILGILGPNGAGKTTTLQMLLGILTPTSGSVHVFGKDIATYKSEVLEHVNFSTTYTDLPWRLTVQENLIWSSYLYDIKDRKKRLAKIKELFRLEPLWKKQMSALSAGQRTRVNLARSMVNFPKLLLLDEPTASLDPEVATYMREFFAGQRRDFKTTIILTSHNMAEVEELCDRVLILKDGEIVGNDTPAKLAKKLEYCHLNLRIIKNATKLTTLVDHMKGSMSENDGVYTITFKEQQLPKFLNTLSEQKIAYSEISIDKPDLEDYFMSVAKGASHEAL